MLVVLLRLVFIFACFLLVAAVLLQEGKGGGISGAFGIGGAGQTLFGASGAGNFLTKATWILGGLFMLLSLLLAIMAGPSSAPTRRGILEPTGAGATAPATGSETGAFPGSAPPGATPSPAVPGTVPPAGGTTTPIPGGTTPPATGTGNATGGAVPQPGTAGATGH